MMHILVHYPNPVCFLNEIGCNNIKVCPRDTWHLLPTKYCHVTLKLQQEVLLKCHARLLKLCIVWSFSTCRPVTDVIGSYAFVGFTSDPENWTENIHVSVLGGFRGLSLSWPSYDPSCSTHGQTATPYCKNATRWPPYPLTGWLCGYGLTGWRPLRSIFTVQTQTRCSEPHNRQHRDLKNRK